MPISFRTSRNIGLAILLLIILIMGISSYLTMNDTVRKLETIIVVEEAKLYRYSEVTELAVAARESFFDYMNKKSESIAPVILLLDEALKLVTRGANLTSSGEEKQMFGEISSAIRRFKSAAFGYYREADKKEEAGLGAGQLERIALEEGNEIMNLTHYASEDVRRSVEDNHSRVLKTTALYHRFLTLIIILGILSTFFIVFLMNYALGHPMRQLLAGTKEIAGGNLGYEISIRSKDEFGELGSAFNRMTRELKELHAKLIQSAKMAAVGQLAGGVAHEINNPLTGILNNIQLIKLEAEEGKSPSAADFKDVLESVEESALRCKRIIRSLLDFSRVSAPVYRPVALNELIEKTLLLSELETKSQNIRVTRELSEDLPLVMADSYQLQQVFLDLINNAVWALKTKKGGELRVKTQAAPDGKSVFVVFSDTGCGIAPENLPRVFEPFFTTKAAGEGTGLGLSVSYGIIREHKGAIEAGSEGPGKGAAFKITLPAL